MKRITRLMAMLATLMLMATVTIVPAAAAGYTDYAYVGTSSSFNSEWEKTRTYNVGSTTVAYMVFGYDTDWIKEDYVWTKATECYSTAMVKRGGHDTSYCEGTEQGQNVYSKIEVTHKTYYVYYKIDLSATYSNVSHTTATSSIK